MWRIPAFLVAFMAYFLGVTVLCATLAEAHIYWAAVTALVVGCGGGALAAFPAIGWVIHGRGGPRFYRR